MLERQVEVGSFIRQDLRRVVFDGALPEKPLFSGPRFSRDVGFDMFKGRYRKTESNFTELAIVHEAFGLLHSTLSALGCLVAPLKAGSIFVGFHAAMIGCGLKTFAKNGFGMWMHNESNLV
ncbi:hypothetical protein NA56DRAFT_748445 [Hyaloscypha hepaticicola]|uniref:Uncharacterized protein n=1 Tax=Hyaloscypha hepaticicola TaxID=2082293 RepID=A0A2J6Q747_9HELO|nr:hypothetical protein NA56DRAFT_748445 [Hyaloscypha hepaticicola]